MTSASPEGPAYTEILAAYGLKDMTPTDYDDGSLMKKIFSKQGNSHLDGIGHNLLLPEDMKIIEYPRDESTTLQDNRREAMHLLAEANISFASVQDLITGADQVAAWLSGPPAV